jgi:hypothetical protein
MSLSDHKPSSLLAMPVAEPARQVKLDLAPSRFENEREFERLRRNLSAVETDGKHIWLAGDEGLFLERLTRPGKPAVYADHRRTSLAEAFDLSTDDGEIDLEGLSKDGSRLWILGSHCLTRKSAEKAAEKEGPADALDGMKIRKRRKAINRCLLGCLDLTQNADAGADAAPCPLAKLRFTDTGSELLDALAEDDHLAPFLKLPAKENGLDFEGIAVRGETAFIGLRGPVIGGLALIVELRLRMDEAAGTLRLGKLDNGRLYAKHAFDLQGLGIRDLAFRGKDLLMLAAPTMALDGIAAVFRWRPEERAEGGGIADPGHYGAMLRLPGGDRGNYAEGITVLDGQLLVVCDQLGDGSLDASGAVILNSFKI